MEKIVTLQIRTFVFMSLVTSTLFVFASEKKNIHQRVISCAVASDEILLQILTRSEKRKRILAVSTLADDIRFSSISKDARDIPHRVGANIEQVLALKPDLVIAASFNQAEFVAMLRKLKIKVHVMEGFQSLNDLKRHIRDIGSLVGAEEEAKVLVDSMSNRILEFKKANSSHEKILPLLSDRTLIGKDTLLDDLLSSVGYTNLAKELGVVGWQKISEEKLLQISPDWILTSAEEKERKEVLFTFSQSPALKKMIANKKKVILISPSLFGAFSPKVLEVLTILNHSQR